MEYALALDLQRSLARARGQGGLPHDVLLLVEHPPVVTLGRASREGHLNVPREVLETKGVDVLEVERGGDVTFHGPGQLVGYPILDLRGHRPDLHWYLRQLEEALIQALASLGVPSQRNPGYTGVWTAGWHADGADGRSGSGEAPRASQAQPGGPRRADGTPARLRKIASIGVHARDWITWHGFALNVSTDLDWFDFIVPCGLSGVEMTSIARELPGRPISTAEVQPMLVECFCSVFQFGRVDHVGQAELNSFLRDGVFDAA